MENNTLFLNL